MNRCAGFWKKGGGGRERLLNFQVHTHTAMVDDGLIFRLEEFSFFFKGVQRERDFFRRISTCSTRWDRQACVTQRLANVYYKYWLS